MARANVGASPTSGSTTTGRSTANWRAPRSSTTRTTFGRLGITCVITDCSRSVRSAKGLIPTARIRQSPSTSSRERTCGCGTPSIFTTATPRRPTWPASTTSTSPNRGVDSPAGACPMNRELIERYAAGADVLSKAIQGLDRAELLAFPVPGTWSIQQIVLHMMDSDLIASDRMKRVAAEDHPTLIGYNETAFAKTLAYDHIPAQDACEVFRLNRRITAELLRRLPDSAFARTGYHNERGEVS